MLACAGVFLALSVGYCAEFGRSGLSGMGNGRGPKKLGGLGPCPWGWGAWLIP